MSASHGLVITSKKIAGGRMTNPVEAPHESDGEAIVVHHSRLGGGDPGSGGKLEGEQFAFGDRALVGRARELADVAQWS